MLIVTGNIPSPSGATAVHVKSLVHCLQNMFIAAHSEVVVGTPNGDSFFLRSHVGTWELFGKSIDVVEITVGLILVLLVQLIIVETFIVEARNSGRMWFWSRISVGFLDKGLCSLRGRSLGTLVLKQRIITLD